MVWDRTHENALTERRLNMVADRIEAVFAGQRMAARCWGGTTFAHSAVFVLTLNPTRDLGRRRWLEEEISLALDRTVRLYVHPGHNKVLVRVFWHPQPRALPAPEPLTVPQPSPWPMRLAWLALCACLAAEIALTAYAVQVL